jgi:hypothetical protein
MNASSQKVTAPLPAERLSGYKGFFLIYTPLSGEQPPATTDTPQVVPNSTSGNTERAGTQTLSRGEKGPGREIQRLFIL